MVPDRAESLLRLEGLRGQGVWPPLGSMDSVLSPGYSSKPSMKQLRVGGILYACHSGNEVRGLSPWVRLWPEPGHRSSRCWPAFNSDSSPASYSVLPYCLSRVRHA